MASAFINGVALSALCPEDLLSGFDIAGRSLLKGGHECKPNADLRSLVSEKREAKNAERRGEFVEEKKKEGSRAFLLYSRKGGHLQGKMERAHCGGGTRLDRRNFFNDEYALTALTEYSCCNFVISLLFWASN